MDTIFALATAPGKSGIAVIRVSGPRAFDCVEQLCGFRPMGRGMRLSSIRDGADILDEGLVLSFPAPGSFTGEEVVEFQLHGSVAIVNSLLKALGDLDSLRHAEPGEFTRRALENGRLDLAQVEGLADLIDSETEAQRLQAQRTFSGALGKKVDVWREKLIRAAALVEATIDFADEDVPEDVTPEVSGLLQDVAQSLESEAAGVVMKERVRTGFEVAIIGPPNIGKSTLLNALAAREAAITSEIAGTTRDVIEVRMDLQGLPVTLLDTAGLRDTNDVVESIGVARAKERAGRADLRVFLMEPGQEPVFPPMTDDILVLGKGDIHAGRARSVSGLTGQGLTELSNQIAEILSARIGSSGTATRYRHERAMRESLGFLEQAQQLLSSGEDQYDIAAYTIRSATIALETLVGRVDVEDLLDEIFASFCLGK
ncbi:MAG: tRNA uridine-5-carboxymethylaminomethyl(34) synthesis GTPase MnmE [Arenibacterium sp.]